VRLHGDDCRLRLSALGRSEQQSCGRYERDFTALAALHDATPIKAVNSVETQSRPEIKRCSVTRHDTSDARLMPQQSAPLGQ
jgi:hypothetical protein